MARLTTAHFGQLEYEAESVFEFPGGVPGFDQHTQFLLLEQAHTKPLVFVQSLLSSDLCFIAVPIQIVDPQYRLELVEDDLASLQFPPASQPQIGQDVTVLALVTVEENAEPTANLRSPLVLNVERRIGLQIIHPDASYSFRHPIQCLEEAAPCS